MASTSIYLNFHNQTEEAFEFYRLVFGGEFLSLHRFSDMPQAPGSPVLSEEESRGIVHIELELLGGMRLMGTDAPESMGLRVVFGNNAHINLEPDTKEEATRLFTELSAGGTVQMPLQDMFWGAYYGCFADKYGVQWMVNYQAKQA